MTEIFCVEVQRIACNCTEENNVDFFCHSSTTSFMAPAIPNETSQISNLQNDIHSSHLVPVPRVLSSASLSLNAPFSLPEVVRSPKLGNVSIFVQLIHRQARTENQLYKNPPWDFSLPLLTASAEPDQVLSCLSVISAILFVRTQWQKTYLQLAEGDQMHPRNGSSFASFAAVTCPRLIAIVT